MLVRQFCCLTLFQKQKKLAAKFLKLKANKTLPCCQTNLISLVHRPSPDPVGVLPIYYLPASIVSVPQVSKSHNMAE